MRTAQGDCRPDDLRTGAFQGGFRGDAELAPRQKDEPIFLLFTQEEREKKRACLR